MKDIASVTEAEKVLRDAIQAAGGLTSTQVGCTLMVYCRNDAERMRQKIVKRAIRTGEAIYLPGGVRESYEWVPVFDIDKRGSECYEWHQDGNRCRHELVKMVLRDGKAARTVIRTGWRVLE